MSHEFDSEEENNIWVYQFEESLRRGTSFFLEFPTFEKLLGHYQDEAEFELALKVCQLAQEQMPFNIEVLNAKAHVLNLLNQFEDVLTLVDEQILPLHPSESSALLEKAHALVELERAEEAIEILNHSLDLAEDRAEVHYRIAFAYLCLEQIESALYHLKKTLSINPTHDLALLELAYNLEQEERDEEALEYYLRYIDEEPYSPSAWYNLGFIYNKMKQPEKAVWAYDYAFLIDEQFSSALFNKGKTHLELEQMEEAVTCFTGVIKIEGPCPHTYTQIAVAYSQTKGQEEKALHFYQTAIQEDPEHSDAWFGLGCLYLKENKLEKAIKMIQKAIDLQKDEVGYWTAMGQAQYLSGKLHESIEAYEEAIVLAPHEINIWLEWSHLYFEKNDFQSAIDIMQEALDEFPMNARCLYRMAAYQIPLGKLKEGISYFRQAIHLSFEQHHEVLVHYPVLFKNPEIQALINEFKHLQE